MFGSYFFFYKSFLLNLYRSIVPIAHTVTSLTLCSEAILNITTQWCPVINKGLFIKTRRKTGKLNLNIEIYRGQVVNPLPQTPEGEPIAKSENILVGNTHPKLGSSIATSSNRYSQRRCRNIVESKMHPHNPFQGASSSLLVNTLDKVEISRFDCPCMTPQYQFHPRRNISNHHHLFSHHVGEYM